MEYAIEEGIQPPSKVSDASVTYGTALVRDAMGRYLPAHPYTGNRKSIEAQLRKAVTQKPEKVRRACERLLTIAADDPDPRNAMAAFTIIADRLDGKPVARVEATGEGVEQMPLAQLMAMILEARRHDSTDANAVIPGDSHTPTGRGDIPVE